MEVQRTPPYLEIVWTDTKDRKVEKEDKERKIFLKKIVRDCHLTASVRERQRQEGEK